MEVYDDTGVGRSDGEGSSLPLFSTGKPRRRAY